LTKPVGHLNDLNLNDLTQDEKGSPIPQGVGVPTEHPLRIGRYRIERVLGEGGFGVVYLAHDEQLNRSVAIKVPHARLISKREDADAYLAEARAVASLDHPSIVPVHDVGSTEAYPCYIVSKYIDGTDLATKLKQHRLKYRDAAELLATVAEALQHAHKQGLVHRDVKPGNILIGNDGKPFIVDFGLALREENIGKGPKYAGTPAYMSPEQARGEGHRVDGRSDIFSLGVVFYELLAGRQPFRGDTKAEVLDKVTSHEPRPLQQYDEKLPKELQRICFKALSKRAADRYSSAHEMAEELRHFLEEQTAIQRGSTPRAITSGALEAPPCASTPAGRSAPTSGATGLGSADSLPIRIVPKGLRSFDAQDADFFLELLPGPRDREGLPDSLRFWKIRVEETDPDNTFSVGLIYGPSGCGKSSLVKAGLMPRLTDNVISVYVEATPDDTETRLLRGLRKRCPALDDNLSLKESLAALRRGQGITVGNKVLIVLDQFEQWLHSKKNDENHELMQALRQCDGGRVQCILMVRDDFWMAVTRFLHALEVRLLEGHNLSPADLFDLDHARKVLAAFGRAFGRLPEKTGETTKEQRSFLEQSVVELADEGKVISVRLAMFAEMMKGKPWTPATLKEVGGTKGIGMTFLEEAFSSSKASPEHRYHQKAIRAVLKALLPDSGTDIKGEMKSYDELLDASGYAHRPQDFDDLIRILDSEIRLITPTDPAGVENEDGSVSHTVSGLKYYQFSHDYLVPSIREWLTRKQKETRKGRAELLLADRVAVWTGRPENRQLPSLIQWVQIEWHTEKKYWTPPQQRMMAKARQYHSLRNALVAVLLVVVTFGGIRVRSAILEQRAETQAKVEEKENATRAEGLVASLLKADIAQVPAIISDLRSYQQWGDPLLKAKLNATSNSSLDRLRLSLALLPVDGSQLNYLGRWLPVCTFAEFPILRTALLPYKAQVTNALWQTVQDESQDVRQRVQAAAALAEYAPDDKRWSEAAPLVAEHLTSAVSSLDLRLWRQYVQPARKQLSGPVTAIYADRTRPAIQREAAAFVLADCLRDRPKELASVILIADDYSEFSPLIAALQPHAATVQQELLDEMTAVMPDRLFKTNDKLKPEEQSPRDAHWQRQSMAAVTLVHLGRGDEVLPLLKLSPNPSLRSLLIHDLARMRTNHNRLAAGIELERDATIRQALIQSLGGLNAALVPPKDRSRIAKQLQILYVEDPDPGVHGSASWALRQWGQTLPELPSGEPVQTAKQRTRVDKLAAKVAGVRLRLVSSEKGIPARQRVWEQKVRPQQPESLSKGLVVHYGFDEGAGSEITSAVDNRSHGRYVGLGQPEWVPGVVGQGVGLRDVYGSFVCSDTFQPDRTDSFSCGCWFLADTNDQRGTLVAKFNTSENRGFSFGTRLNSHDIFCEMYHRWPDNSLVVGANVKDFVGNWHHVVATYDGSSVGAGVKIYVDGRLTSTTYISETLSDSISTSNPWEIGRRDSSYPFKGVIDDVRIYDRQLTADEVQQLFNLGWQSLISQPVATRTPDQQALLSNCFRSSDEQLLQLDSELSVAEAAYRDGCWQDFRRWYVNGQGQTMVVIPNPSQFGDSPITQSFAIASHEVTVGEFRRFRPQLNIDLNLSPDENCPICGLAWYDAVAYCNWLSEREGISPDQWIYEPNQLLNYHQDTKIKSDFQRLEGYRLPTELEWEYACRAGAAGTYCFGEPVRLMERYGFTLENSGGRFHSVESLLPNAFGLFDVHGNVAELSQDALDSPQSPVRDNVHRVSRGSHHFSKSFHAGTADSNSRMGVLPSQGSTSSGFRPVKWFRHGDPEALARWEQQQAAKKHLQQNLAYHSSTKTARQAIEGEILSVVQVSTGNLHVQDMQNFQSDHWSGNRQLLWLNGTKPGGDLKLGFSVSRSGTYDLAAVFTKAPDFAIVKLSLDGKPLGEPIDLYNAPDVVTSGPLNLGRHDLEAGWHIMKVEIVGANTNADKKYFFGLDYLTLEEAAQDPSQSNLQYPRTTASFASAIGQLMMVNDGIVQFTGEPQNCWSTESSRNATDWLQIEFEKETEFSRIELGIYDESPGGNLPDSKGGSIRTPEKYAIEYLTGENWKPVVEVSRAPGKPIGGQWNVVKFEKVKAKKVRVIFTHQGNYRSGVTEFAVWP
jgi:serine/threonine protein kinase